MKLKPEPREIDLYVKQVNMDAKEREEFSKFMKEIKRKNKAKEAKHRKAA
jgi:hypothetical protein